MSILKIKRAVEFTLLFVLLPLSFLIDYAIGVKAALTIVSFIYVLIVLIRVEKVVLFPKKKLPWKLFFRQVGVLFLAIASITIVFMLFWEPTKLFYVPRTKPLLFVLIFIIYAVLSVWPQELVYRTFYFKRYEMLFPTKTALVGSNAIIFSIAHIFFKNELVLLFTLIGGFLFAITYLKFKSTLLVTIEHILYGNWLFAVGFGELLAFPGMEN